MISEDDIKKLFELAKIEATEDELKKFPKEVGSILEYVATLSKVALPEASSDAHDITNNFREDEVSPSSFAEREKIKGSFPENERGFLKTKKVFGD